MQGGHPAGLGRLGKVRSTTGIARPRAILAAVGRTAAVLALVAAGTACAGSAGRPPDAAPDRSTSVQLSARPAEPGGAVLGPSSMTRSPADSAGAPSCADAPPAVAQPAPGTSAGPLDGDAAERQRRVLQAQPAVPQRPNVPPAAVPGAEACVRLLQLEFSLRGAGTGRLDERAVRAALESVGLTAVNVGRGPVFTASTGRACILGTFPADRPAMEIAPLGAGGDCQR